MNPSGQSAQPMVNGGWYNGQQYWNGQLGAPNVINNPNQQGFGQQVSDETNAQSAKAQGVSLDAFKNFLANAGANGNGASGAGSTGLPAGSSYLDSPDVQAAKSKVDDIQKQISDRQAAAATAIKNENDNPFYSDATLTGKIAKINQSLDADLAPLTQQLTDAQSAYQTAVQAATPDLQTIQSTDNQGNLTLATIDKKTGNIVSTQTLGGVGKAAKATGGATTTKNEQYNQTAMNAASDAAHGATLQQLKQHYGIAGGLSDEDIYALYNQYTKRGQAKETLAQFKQGQFANLPGFKPAGSSSNGTSL